MIKTCTKCGDINWSTWTSASTGVVHKYCKTCRQERARKYNIRKSEAKGGHTRTQWLNKLKQYKKCPECQRLWTEIPPRPDKRYKYVWTKDHIIPLNRGGNDNIDNIQPLCFQCNFGKH